MFMRYEIVPELLANQKKDNPDSSELSFVYSIKRVYKLFGLRITKDILPTFRFHSIQDAEQAIQHLSIGIKKA